VLVLMETAVVKSRLAVTSVHITYSYGADSLCSSSAVSLFWSPCTMYIYILQQCSKHKALNCPVIAVQSVLLQVALQ
jgi:hypothetical protein